MNVTDIGSLIGIKEIFSISSNWLILCFVLILFLILVMVRKLIVIIIVILLILLAFIFFRGPAEKTVVNETIQHNPEVTVQIMELTESKILGKNEVITFKTNMGNNIKMKGIEGSLSCKGKGEYRECIIFPVLKQGENILLLTAEKEGITATEERKYIFDQEPWEISIASKNKVFNFNITDVSGINLSSMELYGNYSSKQCIRMEKGYSCSYYLTLSGYENVSLSASDNAGNWRNETIQVFYDNEKPVISMTDYGFTAGDEYGIESVYVDDKNIDLASCSKNATSVFCPIVGKKILVTDSSGNENTYVYRPER